MDYRAKSGAWGDERRRFDDRDGERRFRRDDRPRGGRGRRGGRSDMPHRGSPPPPGTIRLSDRPRATTQWDVPAPGFEEVDALAAKATGLFGAPVNSGVSSVAALRAADAAAATAASGTGVMDASTAAALYQAKMHRQLRRLWVSNVPLSTNEARLRAFFNVKMNERKLSTSGSIEPCMRADVHPDEGYATVEFREPDEATHALTLNGLFYENVPLRIERPPDYMGPDAVPPPGAVETSVPDSPNKLYIGNIPVFIEEGQLRELLLPFGELRHLDLIQDPKTGRSRGMAFCEFEDEGVTDIACEGLDGLEVGEQRLVVKRALIPEQTASHEDEQETSQTPTRAVTMLNMVTREELLDDAEYRDILEDVRDECAKYGQVTDVRIPRPAVLTTSAWHTNATGLAGDGSHGERRGVGRVYVQFAEVSQCEAALQAIAGRQFGGRTVVCAYVRDEAWPAGEDGA